MKFTRRTLLSSVTKGGYALGLAGIFPMRVWANTTVEFDKATLDTFSDGNLVLPGSMILGDAPADEARTIVEGFGLSVDQFQPDCNVTLYRDGVNTVLFDAGAGANFMPTAGKLSEALSLAGLAPEDVTHVVFTHGHPDHLWGVLDDFDDPLFPNAAYMIGAIEKDYWLDPTTPDTIGPERMAFAAGALRYLEAIADRLTTFADGDEVLPGIFARATFGHTPGHMAFELRSGDAAAMVLGDCIGNHHVAFVKPEWHSGTDQDAETAAQTRVRLMAQLADSQMPVIGFHLPSPGIGRVEAEGAGYRFVAATDG